ncbi:MAG: hypothetical protein JKY57_05315 [Kordiimonadaceae bacterium]|nr:hypothetical protein [Kordiimonadaceae bacterium]
MPERLAYSFAFDLLFNGQDMDYCERPLSLGAFGKMPMFNELPDRAKVGVIWPGGGRLIKSLLERGFSVDAFEGRMDCLNHLERHFGDNDAVTLHPISHLDDPMRRDKMRYDALFCMDDLRAFREFEEWTGFVQRMVRPDGYFVYSQVSNKLPTRKNQLAKYFKLSGSYNVSEETAALIRDSYMELEHWDPDDNVAEKRVALKTLDMVKSASSLRRGIMSGVKVSYVLWRRTQQN